MLRRDLALRGAVIGGAAALAGLVADALARPERWTSEFLLAAAVVVGGVVLGWLALLGPTLAVRNVAKAAGRVAEGEDRKSVV